MNLVVVGHVDHGKSTIIGRLLADTDSLPKGKLDSVKEKCRRTSKPFEYAFLLDALKDEQSQGITIDSARCFFKTENRNYMIIDAPGHIEFLKNMVTGASRAEGALLVIDAFEGIKENSKRHGYLLSMLGIKQIIVLVNKMDLVEYSENVYTNIVKEYSSFLSQIGIDNCEFIPVSGREGDNLVNKSYNMPWYSGKNLLKSLDYLKKEKLPEDKPFRMPVQDVYKFTGFGDNRRIIAGTIESGTLNLGDEVIFYPSGKRSFVKSIEGFNIEPKESVSAGYAVGFTLQEQIYVKRGDIAVKLDEAAPKISSFVQANIFWLGKKPMVINKEYYLKIGSAKVRIKLKQIIRILDSSTLENKEKESIETNDAAECILELNKEIAFDLSGEMLNTSRFVIVDEYEIAGGGLIQKEVQEFGKCIEEKENNIGWENGEVQYEERCKILNQKGLVVWFTGLSGAGKSTIAVALEKALIKKHKAVYRLDGDNLRHGLNSDLRFSEEDRNENIRRISEVAAMFKDAAFITLVAAISPYAKMRRFARERIRNENFIEVYVKADIEECMKRDPKGFYKKVKDGKITNYTGVSDPYEEPKNPEVVLDTMKLSVSQCVDIVLKAMDN